MEKDIAGRPSAPHRHKLSSVRFNSKDGFSVVAPMICIMMLCENPAFIVEIFQNCLLAQNPVR